MDNDLAIAMSSSYDDINDCITQAKDLDMRITELKQWLEDEGMPCDCQNADNEECEKCRPLASVCLLITAFEKLRTAVAHDDLFLSEYEQKVVLQAEVARLTDLLHKNGQK